MMKSIIFVFSVLTVGHTAFAEQCLISQSQARSDTPEVVQNKLLNVCFDIGSKGSALKITDLIQQKAVVQLKGNNGKRVNLLLIGFHTDEDVISIQSFLEVSEEGDVAVLTIQNIKSKKSTHYFLKSPDLSVDI